MLARTLLEKLEPILETDQQSSRRNATVVTNSVESKKRLCVPVGRVYEKEDRSLHRVEWLTVSQSCLYRWQWP
eukprot:scaffold35245_cov14-Tisochrysis_lutea.AAC.1